MDLGHILHDHPKLFYLNTKLLSIITVRMPVDKSWIHLKDYWCDAYWNGAIAFVERAK